jgi:hypothetical protein
MGKDFNLEQYFANAPLDFDLLLPSYALAGLIVMAPLICYFKYTKLVRVDLTRASAGLPTEVEITPEEIIQNPALEEIYGAAADDGHLNFLLESNEHYLLNQQIADLLRVYIDNHPQAEQLWIIYSYIEPLLEFLI